MEKRETSQRNFPMAKNLFIVILLTMIKISLEALPSKEVSLKLRKFGQCSTAKDSSLVTENLNLDYRSHDLYVITGDIVIKRAIDQPFTVNIALEKCTEVGSSCELYHQLKVKDLCQELKNPFSSSYQVVKSLGVPPKCPIPEGRYSMPARNVTLDETKKAMVSKHRFWTLRLTASRSSGKNEVCFFCDGEVHKKEIMRTRTETACHAAGHYLPDIQTIEIFIKRNRLVFVEAFKDVEFRYHDLN